MQKILTIFILSLNSLQYTYTQPDTFDFRKARWGMSIDEVIQSEIGNSYEIDRQYNNPVLRLYHVSLASINGSAKVFYEFKNNSLVSVDMILYIENTNNYYNCNNPLPLEFRIDLIQKEYFKNLLLKGYLPAYRWEAGSKGLFSDDAIGKDPYLKPETIIGNYYLLKDFNKSTAENIRFSFRSKRSSINFTFYIEKFDPKGIFGNECNSKEWSNIAVIRCYGNSDVLKNVTNPDF